MRIHGRQIAAARVLLGLSQGDLAAATSMSTPTVRRMEASPGEAAGLINNVKAIQAYLEQLGIRFVNDGDIIGVLLQTDAQRGG